MNRVLAIALAAIALANASVILISSGIHQMGIPALSTYAASKAALRSFVRTWAMELSTRGIRANTLSAGPTETPMFNSLASTPKR